MIEKSVYEDYDIDFSDTYTSDDAYYFIFNQNRELYLKNKELMNNIDDFDINFSLFIGKYKNKDCFVVNSNFDNGFDLREVYEFDKDIYLMGTKAVLVNDWYISHQFCGRCGIKTELDEKDMMLKCSACGQVHYPRIAPAIIVAIRNEDELLMAKHSYHDNIRYALIAGFVEPGESIEEAVHREVREEVGIKINPIEGFREVIKYNPKPSNEKEVVYFFSNPGPQRVKLQKEEVSDYRWVRPQEALRTLSFHNDKNVLRKALEFLKERKLI